MPHPRVALCAIWMLGLILGGVLWGGAGASQATAATPMRANPAAEQWVIEKMLQGEVADLKERFPEEADRVLGSAFLEKFLTEPLRDVKVRRRGMRIRYAILLEPLELENAEIPHEVQLLFCRFEQRVHFARTTFRRPLSLDGSQFKAISLQGMKVAGSLSVREAVFAGPADFRAMEIAEHLQAERAQFTESTSGVTFEGMKVGHSFMLSEAVFAGAADFRTATIARDVVAEKTQWRHTEAEVRWSDVKIGGDLRLRQGLFAGPVTMSPIHIARDLEASEAQFTQAQGLINLSRMVVGRHVLLSQARFAGPVDMSRAAISGNLIADEAQFLNRDTGVLFHAVHVEGQASVRQATFAGPVSGQELQVAHDLDATAAQFLQTERGTTWRRMQIGGSVHFARTLFAGPVDLASSDIAGSLLASAARFTHATHEVTFAGMRIGNTAALTQATFAGPVQFTGAVVAHDLLLDAVQLTSTTQAVALPFLSVGRHLSLRQPVLRSPVDLTDARVHHLTLEGTVPSALVFPGVDLSRTHITGDLHLRQVTLQQLNATALRVTGTATVTQCVVMGEAQFTSSTFGTLALTDLAGLHKATALHLHGMTYQQLALHEDEAPAFLALLNKAHYDAALYSALSTWWRQRGFSRQADAVWVAQQQRACHATCDDPWTLAWWLHLVRAQAFCYGLCPERPIVGSVGVMLFGCLVFWRRRGMEPTTPDTPPGAYSALWYSVDLFLPLVDLQSVREWRPRKERWCARHYMRLHRLLGWLLSLLALVALVGLRT